MIAMGAGIGAAFSAKSSVAAISGGGSMVIGSGAAVVSGIGDSIIKAGKKCIDKVKGFFSSFF